MHIMCTTIPNQSACVYTSSHDGQNAYEDKDSWTGSSWRMIGALSRMHERNMLEIPPIVVCIPCAEGNILPGISRRHSEYGDYTNPISQAHSEFVAEKLHPVIMDRFRVKEGPEHTTTIGSSLGVSVDGSSVFVSVSRLLYLTSIHTMLSFSRDRLVSNCC